MTHRQHMSSFPPSVLDVVQRAAARRGLDVFRPRPRHLELRDDRYRPAIVKFINSLTDLYEANPARFRRMVERRRNLLVLRQEAQR